MDKATKEEKIPRTYKDKFCVSNARMLNIPGNHENALISWNVKFDIEVQTYFDKSSNEEKLGYVNDRVHASLVLTDCFKQIKLDLDSDNKDDLKNSLYKLQVITEEIEKIRQAIIEAHRKRKEIKRVQVKKKEVPMSKEDFLTLVAKKSRDND